MKNSKPKKNSKAKRWGFIFAIELILILLLIPCIFVYSKLSKINTASNDVVNKAKIVVNDDVDVSTKESLKGYHNIALFGVDSREGNIEAGARSDTIIICSINHDTKDVKLLSVYRDTCLNVADHGYTKATHAYAYGGAQLAMSMLNNNFDLDITEFATVDFGIMANIVDAFGGIELDMTEDEAGIINQYIKEQNRVTGSSSELIESAGLQRVNGTQAVAYARIRKIDSDFERARRQRTVLAKIFEEAKKADIPALLEIVDTVLPQVYTNLSTTDIIALAKDVFAYNLADQEGFPFEKTTGSYDGLSYVFAEGFTDNVRMMHEYLFNNTAYTPSTTVQTIGDELYYRTGH